MIIAVEVKARKEKKAPGWADNTEVFDIVSLFVLNDFATDAQAVSKKKVNA